METCDAALILYFPEYGAPDEGEDKAQNVISNTKLISILSKLTLYILVYFFLFKKMKQACDITLLCVRAHV
jgi:hypothetical protein